LKPLPRGRLALVELAAAVSEVAFEASENVNEAYEKTGATRRTRTGDLLITKSGKGRKKK